MYQFSYAEVLDDDPKELRDRERKAIEMSIDALRKAEAKGVRSIETVEALHFTQSLWSVLIEDLGRPENDLPDELRASLISIGLWIIRETGEIRQRKSENLCGLIEVSETILGGLK